MSGASNFLLASTPTSSDNIKYRADIDGLRAVAVMLVMCFHFFPKIFKGGFIGVDIFFVISGYLISKIIFSGIESGKFSFIDFYVRRIRRIFPSLLTVLVVFLALGWILLLSEEYMQLGKHTVSGASFVSNFIFQGEAGYFDKSAGSKPLLHLWSLSIEEQFYIIWPLCVIILWKIRSKISAVIFIILLVSFLLNILIIKENNVGAFYFPWSRFWELMSGCFLASIPAYNGSRIANNMKSFSGLLLIVLALALIRQDSVFPGWWALLPVIGTCLVISAGSMAWFNRVILSHPASVWIGGISFSLYLWHWPLFSFTFILGTENPTRSIRWIIFGLSFLLAWATTKFIERPLRFGLHGKIKACFCLGAMIVIGGTGFAVFKADGLKFRHEAFENGLPEENFVIGNKCEEFHPELKNLRCDYYGSGNNPDVLIIGDSHSHAPFYGLMPFLKGLDHSVMVIVNPGNPPFFGITTVSTQEPYIARNSVFSRKALSWLEKQDSVKVVILAGAWPRYSEGSVMRGRDKTIKLIQDNPGDAKDNTDIFRERLNFTVNKLLSSGKRVIFIVDHPDFDFNPALECMKKHPLEIRMKKLKTPCTYPVKSYDDRAHNYMNALMFVAEENPGLEILYPRDMFCNEEHCWAIKDGEMLYRDNNHLSKAGGKMIGTRLAKMLGLFRE